MHRARVSILGEVNAGRKWHRRFPVADRVDRLLVRERGKLDEVGPLRVEAADE